MTAVPPVSVNLARIVYGADEPSLDDLAENLHEATKLNETLAAVEMRGASLLEVHPELVWSTSRSVKEHDGLDAVDLPEARLPSAELGELLRRRRSESVFGGGTIEIEELATLLAAAYGVTSVGPVVDGEPAFPHRTVPSGGGLYPLDLYVLALRVEGLAAGVYHYHPLRHRLGLLRLERLTETGTLASALVLDAFLDAAVGICVAGVFWRSRFKYGLRGYRFTLLEAGHVCQNLVLAATALGLASCPCGGYFERRLDPLLELDGVDESTLVSVFVGGKS